jgi:hypothetical protein
MLMLELLIKLCSVIPFVLLELCPQSICFELRSPPIIMLLCVGIANFANAFNFIPGDQKGLFKLAVQLRKFSNSVIYL